MIVNELRIGNIVRQLGTFTESTVTAIDSENQTISTLEMSERSADDFDGVLLTDSRLLEFGFKKVGGNFENGLIIIHTNNKTGTFDFLLNEPHSSKLIVRILQYVHQLQNLYFILTGNELKRIEKP